MSIIKFLFKIIGFIIAFFIFILAIISVALYFSDPNQRKEMVVKQFEQMTGQKLVLAGPIEFKLRPYPQALLTDAKLFLKIDKKEIEVAAKQTNFQLDIFSLFSDKRRVKSIDAKNVEIHFFEKGNLINVIMVDSMFLEVITSCCHIEVPNFKMKFQKNDLSGNFKMLFFTETPQISGKIRSRQLNFTQDAKVQENLIKFTPFLADGIKAVKGELEYYIENLAMPDLTLKNTTVKLQVKDNKLILTPSGSMPQGSFSGKITLFQNKQNYFEALTEFSVQSAKKNTLEAKLNISFLPDKPKINGKLSFTDGGLLTPETSRGGKIFSVKPFELGALDKFYGNLELSFDNLNLFNLTVKSAQINLNVSKEVINIGSQGKMSDGIFNGNFTIPQPIKNLPLKLTGYFSLKSANAEEFLKSFYSRATIQGGSLDLNFNGNAQGNNFAELMANLSGKGLMHIKDMRILEYTIDSRYVDLFSAILKKFVVKKNETTLECAAIRLKAKEGIIEVKDSFGLETKELIALGTGKIDLKNEKVDFTFDLSPRSQINIEIGSLDNVFFVKGPFAQLQVISSKQGLIREGGTLALGLATGGVSLLAEKVLKLVTKKRSPCSYVLSTE